VVGGGSMGKKRLGFRGGAAQLKREKGRPKDGVERATWSSGGRRCPIWC
jgi:hypothetical protein